jgi:hypothetical protein
MPAPQKPNLKIIDNKVHSIKILPSICFLDSNGKTRNLYLPLFMHKLNNFEQMFHCAPSTIEDDIIIMDGYDAVLPSKLSRYHLEKNFRYDINYYEPKIISIRLFDLTKEQSYYFCDEIGKRDDVLSKYGLRWSSNIYKEYALESFLKSYSEGELDIENYWYLCYFEPTFNK